MKLNYIELPESEGGSAVAGCGTIHKSEIKPTLDMLSIDLNLPFNLNEYTLGSTGKRDYSGDIDVVIDNNWWTEGPGAFREKLDLKFGKDKVTRNGDLVHLKYPIIHYNSSLTECKPRTGFVQVDFNFGNVEWEKFYHFSPGEKSAYKGAHRNLAISAVSAVVGSLKSPEKDAQGRPVQNIRWTFGSHGFRKVMRRSIQNEKTGDWLKKQQDTVLIGPYFDPNTIAELLFEDENANENDLVSLETILAAVDKYCGLVEKEQIYKRMAGNFMDWNQGKLFSYPEEISRYLLQDDK